MRSKIIIAILVLIPFFTFSQGKKTVKKNQIKSITVISSTTGGEKNKVIKESYEEFDENGNSSLKIDFDKNGNIKTKEANIYNAKGDIIETIKYNGNDVVKKRIKYAYNSLGNKISETITTDEGTILKKNIYTYNAKGLKDEKRIFNPNEIETIKKYSYEYR
ncbi:MAG: hypothetical protein A2X12_08985 [Bacteroidetes bacterium GWE2_29_8]|nr:MAG: hypothetical protein A2X12_08985 [Bacteroidetes bacterium GWE2_29_8]OFY18503.1 MAG: hypothetical protein A2X02_07780 [Bacteroidetes bacterium GWF2_29_10]